MDRREAAFFEHYNMWAELAEKHDVTIYQIVNARQIWDLAYTTGKSDGVTEAMEIVKGSNNA